MCTLLSTPGTTPLAFPQATMHLLAAGLLMAVVSVSSEESRNLFGYGEWYQQPSKPIPQYSWPSKCFSSPSCDSEYPYRSFDGTCNNLLVSSLGSANTSLVRLLEARYSDGKGAFAKSVNGGPLPVARVLHNLLFPDHSISDGINSLAVMVWGQFLTHDTSLIVTKLHSGCCTPDGRMITNSEVPSDCLVMELPEDDPFYSQYRQTCFSLARSGTVNSQGCDVSPLQQLTLHSSFLDMSMVYGKNKAEADSLRSFVRGRLRTQEDEDGREFLPNVNDATKVCPFSTSPTDFCFVAGDVRVNQQPPLSAIHTIALREHNLLCDQLYLLNTHWTDEKIYQTARSILIAQYQHITYSQFLPILLGLENTAYYKLLPATVGYGFGYDPEVNPGTLNMFTTAAFRSFHSVIPDRIEFPMEGDQCPLTSKPLSDVLNRPSLLVEDDNLDNVLRGFSRQPAYRMDPEFNDQISNVLFRSATKPYGFDLVSIDIMRGRDHGLPSYNSVRDACGLGRAKDFSEFGNTMSKKSYTQLKDAYQHVDDVDLYVGGLMEDLVPGTLVGRVFQCIIAEQFRRLKFGDRFFHEFGGYPGAFRLDQLEEIKKSSLSLLICRNADRIKKVPIDSFAQPSSRNSLVRCKDMPSLNLRLWQE